VTTDVRRRPRRPRHVPERVTAAGNVGVKTYIGAAARDELQVLADARAISLAKVLRQGIALWLEELGKLDPRVADDDTDNKTAEGGR
jgi:hypothetical protein